MNNLLVGIGLIFLIGIPSSYASDCHLVTGDPSLHSSHKKVNPESQEYPRADSAVKKIPKNLDECFLALEQILTPQELEKLKSAKKASLVPNYHFGLALWIRNNWGLWKGSTLREYLQELGLTDPDDMSAYIIERFWEHLNGKPIQLHCG